MKRFFSALAAAGLLLGFGTTALGQFPGEVVTPQDFHTPFNEATPFVEPGYFDHDFQFFAPADVDEFGGFPEPSVGWFVDYDRMAIQFSRPEQAFQNTDMDGAWGNRYDIGYMLEEDNGWLFEFIHLDGPTQPFVNNAEFWSVELNKTFRLEPLYNGGIIEVFGGPKYVGFTDSFDPQAKVRNVMLMAQGGMRYQKRKGRWLLSTEARLFGGPNWQQYVDDSKDEFVVGGEIRGEGTFIVTRDIGISVGFQVQHYGTGIARGTDQLQNDQDMTNAGVTFGLVFNRF